MAENQNRTLTEQFMLRLPDGMRSRIKAVADANQRSMNSEILAILEEKFPAPKLDPYDEMNEAISRIADTIIFEEGIEITDPEELRPIMRRAMLAWGEAKGPFPINEAAPRVFRFTMKPKDG